MAQRICAWVLIAMLLPSSAANALLVWCSSADGHAAVEFTLGSDFHHVGATTAKKSTSGHAHAAAVEHRCHDTDCVDTPAISSAVLSKVLRVEKAEKTNHVPEYDAGTIVLALSPQNIVVQTTPDHSRSSYLETRERIDPTILAQRFTVLRI